MKDKVKTLWKLCFDDTESFIDLYFQHRYKEDRNIEIVKENEVLAALQLIDYPIKLWGTTLKSQYVSGVCTHPNHRNKGIAKELMKKAIWAMYDEEVAISTLIPAEGWLADYYRKFGYEYIFDYVRYEAHAENSQPDSSIIILPYTTIYKKAVYSYYAQKQEERDNCLLHTDDDLNTIIADLEMGGELLVAFSGERICGLAFAYNQPNEVTIGEMMNDTKEIESSFINYITKQQAGKKIYIINRVTKENANNPTLHLGMGRIINAKQFLNLWAKNEPQQKHHFNLTDSLIEANSGYYHIEDGRVSYSPQTPSNDCLNININQLILHLIGNKNLYMNLMLN